MNPTSNEILGKRSYDIVSEIADNIDVVNVFRPSDQVLPVIQEAIKIKPKVIWLQEGIHNLEAEESGKKSRNQNNFQQMHVGRTSEIIIMTDFENFYRDLLET